MRGSSRMMLASLCASMALCAVPPPVDDMADEERKTPPPPNPEPAPTNLPGETNRQFAARMKAEGVKP